MALEEIVLGSASDLSRMLQPHLAAESSSTAGTTKGAYSDEQDQDPPLTENDSSTLPHEPLPASTRPVLNIVADDVTAPIIEQQGGDVQRETLFQTAVAEVTVGDTSSQRTALNVATDQIEGLTISTNQTEVAPSAPAQLTLTETVQLVRRDREVTTATSTAAVPLYPRLDSITRALGECKRSDNLPVISTLEYLATCISMYMYMYKCMHVKDYDMSCNH